MVKSDIKVTSKITQYNNPPTSTKEGQNSYVENYKNNLTSDKIEISNKKEAPKKKSFWKSKLGIATMAASATLATIGGIRLHKSTVFEKQAKKIYNEVANDIAKQMEKQGLKFEKPKIQFEGLMEHLTEKRTSFGRYHSIDNKIIINRHKLMGNVYVVKHENGRIAYAYTKKSLNKMLAENKGCKLISKLSQKEKEIHITKTIAHETRHSLQNQVMLTHDRNTALKRLVEDGNIENIKNSWAYNFKQEGTSSNILPAIPIPKIKTFSAAGKEVDAIAYKADEILEGAQKYSYTKLKSKEEWNTYLSNPIEIDAEAYAYEYVRNKFGSIKELPENIQQCMITTFNKVYYGLQKTTVIPIAYNNNKPILDKTGNFVKLKYTPLAKNQP